MISALGVKTHQLWMLWVGSGIIGGVGLGLGYISPVSTLIKWFPDRRGMATGMAIMGFGGGAMIGSPLANLIMNHFKTPICRPWSWLFCLYGRRRLFLPGATGSLEPGRLVAFLGTKGHDHDRECPSEGRA